MEVFDIPVTKFLQFKFETYATETAFLDDVLDLDQARGVCIQYSPQKIVLPPPDRTTIAEMLEWAHDEKDSAHPDEELEIVYWKLVDWEETEIKRNSKWFGIVKKDLYRAHLEIQGFNPTHEYPLDMPAMSVQCSYSNGPGRRITNYVPTKIDICGGSDTEEPMESPHARVSVKIQTPP